jgi:poly(beta-D-mannuronate) lyase
MMTRPILLALVLAALAAAPAVAQVEITPPASGVTASTSDDNVAANAVDNNLGTRWSGNGDGAWLRLDLGSVRSVGSVRIAFFNGNTRRSRFDLQLAAAAGGPWTNALTNVLSGGTTTAEETFDFPDASARFVRYLGHGNDDPAKATWSSLSEVSVFAGTDVPPTATPTPTATPAPSLTPTPTATPTPTTPPLSTETPTPTATSAPSTDVKLSIAAATASTHDGNTPANAVDGNLTTRWSANGDGHWLKLDLGASQSVSLVKVAIYAGNTRSNDFELQVSANDADWTTVFDGLSAPNTTALQTFDFDDRPARWVRYLGHGNSDPTKNTWNSVSEVEVWGGGCTSCPTATPTPTPTATPVVPTPTPTPTTPPTGDCARTINVSTSAQLGAAATAAQPGDCIVAADGTYSAFTVTADGTSGSPIVIRSANLGGATISSGIVRLNGASWVTLEGFRITSGGGSTTLDGETRSVIVSIAGSNNCRITRCNFKPSGHGNGTGFVMLNGNSNNNRVDHNDFGPNTADGVHYVWPLGNRVNAPGAGLTRAQWANGQGPVNPNMARDTQVDHNHFHDMASGTAECIVLGGLGMVGDYQDLRTIVEYNLFTACDGDPEIVSIKSSGNIVRFNTLRNSGGGFVSRAGNRSQIYGNFVFGNGKGGSHGVRIHEMDHTVFNNYIENVSDYPINIASGHSYTDGSFTHARVVRARVVHNTVVNYSSRPVIFGWGNSGTRTLAPLDSVFANNVLQGSGTLTSFPNPGNMAFSSNIANGTLGASRPASEFALMNPMLVSSGGLLRLSAGSPAIGFANPAFYAFVTEDMDGQTRSDPDAGADEFATGGVLRRALTTADVGPNAP